MKYINYISNIASPFIIFLIILYAILEKKSVFDNFLDGAKEGLKTTIKIFPTLIALFLAIEMLNNCGIFEVLLKILNPFLFKLKIPGEIVPLMMLRPISGSGSIAIATNIMQKYGVDSNIGIIASTIMGSTETTLYTIAIYSSSVKIKKTRFVLLAALAADITGMIVSIIICRIMS